MVRVHLAAPTKEKPRQAFGGVFCWIYILRQFGEPGGARTRDHMIKSHVLYQLSYRPKRHVQIGEARAGVNAKLAIASIDMALART